MGVARGRALRSAALDQQNVGKVPARKATPGAIAHLSGERSKTW